MKFSQLIRRIDTKWVAGFVIQVSATDELCSMEFTRSSSMILNVAKCQQFSLPEFHEFEFVHVAMLPVVILILAAVINTG
jgi:hypothetical protein